MARGDGIYKRKDSKYWWACYTPPNGLQVRRSTKTADKASAKRIYSLWYAQAWSEATGVQSDRQATKQSKGSSLTLGELAGLWKQEHTGTYLASGSSRWNTLLVRLGGKDRLARDVTQKELERLRAGFAESMKRSSVNLHLSVLRGAFAIAVRHGELKESPAAKLKNYAVSDQRDRVMSEEEERQLLAAAKPGMQIAIVVAVETGMRKAAVAALSWEHIELDRRVITMPASLAKNRKAWQVPISARLLELLRGLERSSPIVPYKNASISPLFHRLCKAEGVKDLRFHDLRHTCATRLRRAGVDWFTLMKTLNHQNPKHAMRYQTISGEDLVEAVKKLDRAREESQR